MPHDIDYDAAQAMALVLQISPLLAGHSPEVVGSALCELTATWIAGYTVQGLRQECYDFHMKQVALMVPQIAAERGEGSTKQ